MKTLLLVLLLNLAVGVCGVLSWQAVSGSWAVIWGLGLALGLFTEWVWLMAPRDRSDALTLASRVGKPQAAGLQSDRTRIDRRAHVIQIARTK